MKRLAFLLALLAQPALADYVREGSFIMAGQFIDNGDSTPFVMVDKATGKKFVGFRFVNDGNQALHGRLALYGECIDPLYENWNCGGIDFSNTRSPRTDNRLAIIRARGYDSQIETSGILDFFTWDAQASHFQIGMHLSKGRLSVGDNGYPFANHATAWLMLGAGTKEPRSAPLKFNAGPLLETPEPGAVEYDGQHLYLTVGTERNPITVTPWKGHFFNTLWANPNL